MNKKKKIGLKQILKPDRSKEKSNGKKEERLNEIMKRQVMNREKGRK